MGKISGGKLAGIIVGSLILVAILVVIIVAIVDPKFMQSLENLSNKASYVVSSGFTPHQAPGEQDPLSSGINDSWYSTVTSDNNHYMDDYQSKLEESVVTGKMKHQHGEWANEIAPKSRTAMMIGDMEEAATMSTPRYGLNAFRFETPKTHGCKSQFVEGDEYRHKYSSKLRL
jgi:hypothetical protein